MGIEMIAAREEDGTVMKIASREEIHRQGLWHETFHCWIVEIKNGTPYIHLQLRSPDKKDFPKLLDISAAGHILAYEPVEDGIREVEEELGIDVEFEELIPLGLIKDQLAIKDFIDNERCHVFLYVTEEKLDDKYRFQQEEVAGMYTFDFGEFAALCRNAAERIESEGEISPNGELLPRTITLADLVPHSKSYLAQVIEGIQNVLHSVK